MGRRKQDKPAAFKEPVAAPTPSEIDGVALQSSRPNSGDEHEKEKRGLVAAIWDAALQDQAIYEQYQRNKGEARAKRKRGSKQTRKNQPNFNEAASAATTATDDVWFSVEGTDVAVFATVAVSRVGGRGGGEVARVATKKRKMTTTNTAEGKCEADVRPRDACSRSCSCSVADDKVLLRTFATESTTYTMEIGSELVQDVVPLLRSNVLAVTVDDEVEIKSVGLGVNMVFALDEQIPEDARQCLKRVVLGLRRSDAEPAARHLPQIVSMDEDEDTELDASRLYELIKPTGEEPEYEDEEGRLVALRATLHGYQRRVLRWMVARETHFHCFDDGVGPWKKIEVLKSLSKRAQSCFYMHTGSGEVVPEAGYASRVALPAPKGGIACDEMGLGKTVEVLALIAANPFVAGKGVKAEEEEGGHERGIDVPQQSFTSSVDPSRRQLACVCGTEGRLKDAGELPPGLLLIECSACGVFQHMHCLGITSFTKPGDWKCTGCCAAEVLGMGLLESKTTLIVCPMPILSQWQSEIDKHIVPGTLKVATYLGQDNSNMISPQYLAAADIVLTTYDTLRKDLHRNPDKEAVRSLRHTKRYHAVPTPLTSIKFWRIVVDEAQMVESSTAKATEMVRKIAAVNHWAVTGTPISRGLEDLYGLFAFLGLGHIPWHSLIQHPIESGMYDDNDVEYEWALSRLIKLLKPSLGGIMWRSSKKDVAHELRLPTQTACHNKLRFSNIEKHFYDRQHQACCSEANKALSKSLGRPVAGGAGGLQQTTATPGARNENEATSCGDINEMNKSNVDNDKNSSRALTKREERKLLLPLLRLRQACVHPQVGAGGLKSLSDVKTPMSMLQVLKVMVGKAKVEAEDAQRLVLSTINGLAGLEILRGQFAEAASRYRSVLKISKDNEEFIRMDKLQTLHTVYNLTQILDKPGVGRCLEDDLLAPSIEPLERKYLGESTMRLQVAETDLAEVQNQADNLLKKFSKDTGIAKDVVDGWWVAAIALIVAQHDKGPDAAAGDLVARIKKDLNEEEKYRRGAANAANIADSFRELSGMQELISTKLKNLEESRASVVSLLKHLGERVARQEAALIDTAAHCGTCRSFNATSGIMCEHCHFNKDMMAWEMQLFSLMATKFVTSYGGRKKKKSGEEADDEEDEHEDAALGLAPLDAQDVADHAHRRAMHRVGVGGLGEGAAGLDNAGLGTSWEGDKRRSGRTGANKVSNSNVVRRPSQTEHILRIVLNVLKRTDFYHHTARGSRGAAETEFLEEKKLLIRAAECHLGILELRRKEYLRVGSVAMSQRGALYALDELQMSRMRIKLRSEGQVLSAEEERYIVLLDEVPTRIEDLQNELVVAEADLNKSLGTLKYLKFLERLNQPGTAHKNDDAGEPGAVEFNASTEDTNNAEDVKPLIIEPCPVCHDDIEDDLAMLPCGHILCVTCNLKILEKENRARSNKREPHMKCPTCRAETLASDTAMVVTKSDLHPTMCDLVEADTEHNPELWHGEEALAVHGGYGTKLEAVVRRVKMIRDKLPEDKIIIFSTWQDALDIVAHALGHNGVPSLYPKNRKAFDESLSQFRVCDASTEKTPRVLLLLLKQGGNGLNLQQAQHVMFLEPVMDPGEELQAVGRVDRMGQTRDTFVHRFSFRNSVEENVLRISAEKRRAHQGKGHKKKVAMTVAEVSQLLR